MEKIKEFYERHRILVFVLAEVLVFIILVIALFAAFRMNEGAHISIEATTESMNVLPQTVAVIASTTTTTTTTETTTTTTTTEPPPPPDEILLEDVPYICQHGLLPTGCELVSAKMVLEYFMDEEVPIEDIIDRVDAQYPQIVDGEITAPHPSEAFIGSPWDPDSFGCFAPIICDMMNDILPDEYVAIDTTGTPIRELAETYLPQGKPVLIWATIGMWHAFPYGGWFIMDEHGHPSDEWYDWLVYEHCLVLIGYDEDYYYFNDPYDWNASPCTKYSRELVEERCEEMDRYSAVVIERPEGYHAETYVATRVYDSDTSSDMTGTTTRATTTTATVPLTELTT